MYDYFLCIVYNITKEKIKMTQLISRKTVDLIKMERLICCIPIEGKNNIAGELS